MPTGAISVTDLETCNVGDYLALWANLPAGTGPPTEADPEICLRLAERGLRPAIDDVGLSVTYTDEAEALVIALARFAGELAERIAEHDGDDPATCGETKKHAVLRAALRLWGLPIEELRRRRALIGA